MSFVVRNGLTPYCGSLTPGYGPDFNADEMISRLQSLED